MAEEWPTRSLPDHVTKPLLTLITEQSIDQDYREVAARRGAGGPAPRGARHWVAVAVVTGFGILVTVAAVQTSRNESVDDAGRATLIARVNQERDSVADEQGRVADLQDEILGLEEQLDDVTAAAQAATAEQLRRQALTGYTAVTGPGVEVVVDDAPQGDATQLVRAADLALLVDGLWNAGAEAIAVDDHRLTVLNSFHMRGPAVYLGEAPLNPPYVVEAIGDTDTLQANLLDTSHGQQFFDLAGRLGFEIAMQNEDVLQLPAAKQRRLRHVTAGTGDDRPGIQGEQEGNP